MNQWIDVTRPIDERLDMWPGRPRPQQRWEKRIAEGAVCNASFWDMSAHSGTHMDAPLHFVADGEPIDRIPPDVFLGSCQVVDIVSSGADLLDQTAAKHLVGVERLLIRSRHSTIPLGEPYAAHGPILSPTAAALLIDGGLRLLGTDRLTVDDSAGEGIVIHNALLGAGCVIVECLWLREIAPGPYELSAAPLRLVGSEASPIRAFLKMS